jgi:hypothetical protein
MFLTLALDGGEFSASDTSRFTFGEIAPSTHLTGSNGCHIEHTLCLFCCDTGPTAVAMQN